MNAVKGSVATRNPLLELQRYGQSIWLDYIRRNLITGGGLKQLVNEDGLRGVTSNPTIFDKAIAGSTDYDEGLRALLRADPAAPLMVLFDSLEIEDIRAAGDVLRPVYDQTQGGDGFVSIEVSPRLARDTAGTIAEARRLWRDVDRTNVMIKVPATPEGIPAIYTLTAEGINVNITLMFSMAHYDAVANAYISGLERNPQPQRVSSVASFFVSRVDTAVDQQLEKIGSPEALALRGKVAIANAKVVYQRFRETFTSDRWAKLAKRGARVQRPLWASTGTKNPAYSDVLYVESLIGSDTVNTMPPATMGAFRDHGHVHETLTKGLDEARDALQRLARLGIDLNAVTEKLQDEGVVAFSESLDKLLASLEEKRCAMLATEVDRQAMSLGRYGPQVEERVNACERGHFLHRLWARDYTLWSPGPVPPELTDRLGWLTLPESVQEHVPELRAFAEQARAEGTRHVVLLGMGGSSLAPEVFQRTFGNATGFPELIVLDSTHPQAVRAVERQIDIARALFVVSSKSGTTTETLSFFKYFWNRAAQALEPGKRFVAITDPGTALEKLADERRFRRVLPAPSDVGGRYSALSVFGLAPAALIGADIGRVLDQALTMAEASAFCVPEHASPAVKLGAALGELALTARDKITFLASPTLQAFPVWLEQLIAESTGKQGKGIVPVADEPAAGPEQYGADRVFVYLSLEGEADSAQGRSLATLEAAGHPVVRIHLRDRSDLGQEFFRWELATAVAGALLGINPFDQPDVQLAKDLAKSAMANSGAQRAAAADLRQVGDSALAPALQEFLPQVRAGDYFGIQAYLAPTAAVADQLQAIRVAVRDRLKIATTVGFGPRFLHSTGQLHKGGPNNGVFLQLVDQPTEDVAVPESNYTFGELILAQAEGDYQALKQRGRRVLRVNLGKDPAGGLARLLESAALAMGKR